MFLFGNPWFAAYNDGAGEAGGADGTKDPPTPKTEPPAPASKTFSQDQLNKFLAEDRRKHQDQIKSVVTQLEDLKKTKELNDQQRTDLETRIETLNSSLLTAEERAKQELTKKDKDFKTAIEQVHHERDQWKSNYSTEVITNQILKASVAHKAINPEQIHGLLAPKTRLVEVLGSDGKTVTGYIPKVKITSQNEKGEAVELDLTVEDAVKHMKGLSDRWGNLFDSGVSGGLGGKGSSGSGGSIDLAAAAKKSPEAYREARKKLGLGIGRR